MDPDATLRELRQAVWTARRAADDGSNDAEIEAWQQAGELFDTLDGWIKDGGALPSDWTPPTERRDGALTFTRR